MGPGNQNHHLLLKIDTLIENEGWSEKSSMKSSPMAAQDEALSAPSQSSSAHEPSFQPHEISPRRASLTAGLIPQSFSK